MSAVTKLVILVFGFLGVIGLLGVYRAGQVGGVEVNPSIEPAVVRCISLERRSYAKTEQFTGRLEANVRVNKSYRMTGQILRLGPKGKPALKAGHAVTKGQIIAMVDPARYQVALMQAKASQAGAKADQFEAKAKIAEAKAKLKDATLALKRLENLDNSGTVTRRELEEAQTERESAQAKLDAAEAGQDAAAAMYRAAESTIRLAEINLADATLRAPMDAVVADVPVKIGQIVHAGQTVITLVDTSKVKLVVGVVELKRPLIKTGQPVSVEVRALQVHASVLHEKAKLSRPRPGVVSVVPPTANLQTGLFDVEITLDNDDGWLSPGMIARANVTVLKQDAIAIPIDAVIRKGGRMVAYFVADKLTVGLDLHGLGQARIDVPTKVARRIEFEPIVVDKDYLLIAEAPPGVDRLIVEGQHTLIDGQPVHVLGAPLASQQVIAPDAGSLPSP